MPAMLSLPEFEALLRQALPSLDLSRDVGQFNTIVAPADEALFVVAGPGTGKTTGLTLRILKLILVDGLEPEEILATTYTRRAAKELRSRLLRYAEELRQALLRNPPATVNTTVLAQMDFNKAIIGTLDSIAQDVLQQKRPANLQPPVIVEDFVADSIMMTEGVFAHGLHNDVDYESYVFAMTDPLRPNFPSKVQVARAVNDRLIHEGVSLQSYQSRSSRLGSASVGRAIESYRQFMSQNLVQDYAELEQEFLNRLKAGILDDFRRELRAIIVDEYQDTNFLQQCIYFELGRHAIAAGGSITVVGDDDQALYRFRGATVEVFVGFPASYAAEFGRAVRTEYLTANNRSTDAIVDFANDFVALDSAYQTARVPGKPPIARARTQNLVNFPVIGLFRDDRQRLAGDLADLIESIIHTGYTIPGTNPPLIAKTDLNHGGPGDIALLCGSPAEFSSGGKERLPLLLRRDLAARGIHTFNPRGQELANVGGVETLCGLMLECFDPGGIVQGGIPSLGTNINSTLNRWRTVAQGFAQSNPSPPANWSASDPNLVDYVAHWQNRRPHKRNQWADRVSLGDLAYKLLPWIPYLQNDIEGLVHLEVVQRTITQGAQFSKFDAEIVFDPPHFYEPSVKEAIRRIFSPIASGAIAVNEELLETLPSDRVNIMSIHQAKGLEFPVTIVDVGSDFSINNHLQAFKRFPRTPGKACAIEDEIEPFTGRPGSGRSGLDRAFDDLIRQYFVAASRAQDLLILVGLMPNRLGRVKNMAVGWKREGTWPWAGLPNLTMI